MSSKKKQKPKKKGHGQKYKKVYAKGTKPKAVTTPAEVTLRTRLLVDVAFTIGEPGSVPVNVGQAATELLNACKGSIKSGNMRLVEAFSNIN